MKVQTLIVEKNELTDLYLKCMNSFILHGVDVDLYTYDVDNIKKECKRLAPEINVLNGSAILDKKYINKCKTTRVFSNHFRYTMLLKNKGWWVDADNIMISDFDNEGKDFLMASYEIKNRGISAGNGNVMYYNGGKTGTLVLNELVDMVENPKEEVKEYKNGGAYFFLNHEKIKANLADIGTFNPMSFWQKKDFYITFTTATMELLENASMIHTWAVTRGTSLLVEDSLAKILLDYMDKGEKITRTKLRNKCSKIMKTYNIKKPNQDGRLVRPRIVPDIPTI